MHLFFDFPSYRQNLKFNAMKKMNNRIRIQWIIIITGMLFSTQIIFGQTVPVNSGIKQVKTELNAPSSAIDSGAAFYYLYACNVPNPDQLMNCIVLLKDKKEFDEELLRQIDEESVEEPLKIEPWMLNPKTLLNNQKSVYEQYNKQY